MKNKPRLIIIDPVKGPGRSFVRHFLSSLEPDFDIELEEWSPLSHVEAAFERADVVWIDWASEHAAQAATLNKTFCKPLLVRLHSFEALEGDWIARIDWTQVSVCVAVGSRILSIAMEQSGALAKSRTLVIPNGIDMERFMPRRLPARTARRVAWVGDITPKKSPLLALQIFAEYIECDPKASLHVAGEWKHFRTRLAVEDFVEKAGLRDRVRFDGHVSDMPGWLGDKDVLLSTSIFESFGYAIGEAMASGLDVVAMQYPGAEQTWPAEILSTTIGEALIKLGQSHAGRWRDVVGRAYPLQAQQQAVRQLLQEFTQNLSAPDEKIPLSKV